MGNIEKFDIIARQYDIPGRIEIAKVIADEIRRHVTVGKSAIDYGCGTGIVGLELLNIFSNVLFIDASPKMIEIVEEKLERINAENAKAMCLDFEVETPPNLKTDYILVVQTLLHIKDTESILSQLYSLLNTDGHLIIVDFDKTEGIESTEVQHGFGQEELINDILKLGFSKATAHTFYRGEKIFMGKDAGVFLLDAKKIDFNNLSKK